MSEEPICELAWCCREAFKLANGAEITLEGSQRMIGRMEQKAKANIYGQFHHIFEQKVEAQDVLSPKAVRLFRFILRVSSRRTKRRFSGWKIVFGSARTQCKEL